MKILRYDEQGHAIVQLTPEETEQWDAADILAATYCYKRHEPAPGVHQDIPHLNTQCIEPAAKVSNHWDHNWTIDQDKRIGTCQLCGLTAPWRPNGR